MLSLKVRHHNDVASKLTVCSTFKSCYYKKNPPQLHISGPRWHKLPGNRWIPPAVLRKAFAYHGITHYIDVIMTTMASQIISLTVVYSIVYSGADQRKHQSSASLALCGEFTETGEFPAQRASNAENVSIWWRHHDDSKLELCLWSWNRLLTSWRMRKAVLVVWRLTWFRTTKWKLTMFHMYLPVNMILQYLYQLFISAADVPICFRHFLF